MRLMPPKQWSRTDLSGKLRAKPFFPFLSWEQERALALAFKTTLAAGLCWWIAYLFGLHDGYWGSISAIIVMQSYVGATVTASRDRLIGTFIGAVFGFLFSLWNALPWNFVCALMAALALSGMLRLKNSARLAGVTVCIVMLVHTTGSHWPIALGRISEVALGVVVALAVSTLVFPDRARIRLKDNLAREYLQLGSLFEATLKGYGGKAAANLAQLREETLQSLEANNELMEAARNEPSGGAGWQEGLNTLSQFGWALFDAIGALELAAQGSADDAYSHQLDPALGMLATDILNGFHYVAHCIDRWRFHAAPKGINLEEDITKLEARMAEIRHTGLTFSQDEILRAYAVQLHLKQIARILRASRVQTSVTVGEAHRKPATT
ncbi:MAG: FUSC family protein [Acidobacteriota bacterium]|nr:FUSC family protein [Acidobacteriota bacterium]